MLAIIGGSGLSRLPGLDITHRQVMRTPYGEPSCPLSFGQIAGRQVIFLARHGYGRSLAPHEINYRANIWALAEIGVSGILAVGSVGGIHPELTTGTLAVPDQILDYTHSRAATFFEGPDQPVVHVDFSYPYDVTLRCRLLEAAATLAVPVHDGGCYAATQGPRLETAAEIRRLGQDGADMVGMTGMPEAALAREKHLPYATLAVVANRAAGLNGAGVEIDFQANQAAFLHGLDQARRILVACCSPI